MVELSEIQICKKKKKIRELVLLLRKLIMTILHWSFQFKESCIYANLRIILLLHFFQDDI